MPMIDVTELLIDSDFCEPFQVLRGAQVVNSHGETVTTQTTFNLIGSVQAGSPSDLIYQDDAQAARNNIIIYARFDFYDISTNYTSDIVVWNKNQYKITKTYDWPNWGKGWNAAVCELIPVTEAI